MMITTPVWAGYATRSPVILPTSAALPMQGGGQRGAAEGVVRNFYWFKLGVSEKLRP